MHRLGRGGRGGGGALTYSVYSVEEQEIIIKLGLGLKGIESILRDRRVLKNLN